MKGSKTLFSYILFVIGLQWKTVFAAPSSHCAADQFQCRNTRCVEAKFKCDGDNDCGDKSDEEGCNHEEKFKKINSIVRPCDTSRHFQCKNLKCLPMSYTCDYIDDCGDGSDELSDVYPYCSKPETCPIGAFRCSTSGKCIAKEYICDGEFDCGENDDSDEEQNCKERPKPTCDPTMFKCNNGRCIDKMWLCDYEDDCGDHSDERNCNTAACPAYPPQFKCKASGYCIQASVRCNGDFDCLDHSDEEGCKKVAKRPSVKPLIGLSSSNSSNYTTSNNSTVMPNTTIQPTTAEQTTVKTTKKFTTPTGKTCRPSYFKCKASDKCVHRMWLCDGSNDCEDGSDESADVCKCKDDEFKCSNNICIPKKLKCNGVKNCLDGSDENSLTCPESVSCSGDVYHCADSAKCINSSYVCNGKEDCPYGDDEQDTCSIDECLENNGGCSHGCKNTRLSYECECPTGYKLGEDGKTCFEINECDIPGFCSHNCENLDGNFRCTCDKGYMLLRNKRYCVAKGPKPSLMFSSGKDIRQMTTNFNNYKSIVNSTKQAVSIDLHIEENMIYWADRELGTINRSPLDQTNMKVEVLVKNISPHTLAIDWISKKMYWTQKESDYLYHIRASNLEGTHITTIVKGEDGNQFQGLSVFPEKGYLFWSDIGDEPKIERSLLDGSNRMIIVNSNETKQPTVLTMDRHQRRLYWSDHEKQLIVSSKIDGSDMRVVKSVDSISCELHGLAVFEDHLYWTCYGGDTIKKANKFTGEEVTGLKESVRNPFDIVVYHPIVQQKVRHPCEINGGGCNQLCFVVSPTSSDFVCGCSDGYHLLDDGKTCVPDFIPKTQCGAAEHLCRYSNLCISRSHLCDGQTNCPLEDDEENCPVITKHTEPSKQNASKSSIYIAASVIFVLICLLILFALFYLRRRKRGINSNLSIIYETDTVDDGNDEKPNSVEIKYKKQNKLNKKLNKKLKNFSSDNYDVAMSNVDGDYMIDDEDLDDEPFYSDKKPILT